MIGAGLFAAVATWWLANVALQGDAGFTRVPILSTDAAGAAVLAQWMLVALFAAFYCDDEGDDPMSAKSAGLHVLAIALPLWPLFALLWLTSELSARTLLTTQFIAVAIGAIMYQLIRGIAVSRFGLETQRLLAAAAGGAVALIVFVNRTALFDWLAT